MSTIRWTRSPAPLCLFVIQCAAIADSGTPGKPTRAMRSWT